MAKKKTGFQNKELSYKKIKQATIKRGACLFGYFQNNNALATSVL